VNWQDHSYDDRPTATATKRQTFVPPGPTASTAITPVRVEVLPPEAHTVDMPTPAAVQSITRGTYLDRAQGFRHKMMPVAIVAGVLGAIAAINLFGVPLLSFALLMWFFTVFCLTWLGGFALDVFISADGAAVLQVLGMYRILSREQKARLRRMERDR
jgi:hypothetical protein